MLKYNPLGSVFKEGEHILQVEESKDGGRTCNGCWYASVVHGNKNIRNYKKSCFTHGHVCTPLYRKDRKQVIFKKVK